jgi:pimeloyl-ACP methyl ester carboxylesterase
VFFLLILICMGWGCGFRRPITNMQSTTKNASMFTFSPTTSLYYEVEGSGDHALVLLHGFGASHESWRDIQPLLSSHFRLYLVDLKGFGMSSKPDDRAYSISDQAEIIVAFIRHHKLKKVVVVGHSYGGAVALMTLFQLQENDRTIIDSLVLIDSAAYLQDLPFFISMLRNPILRRVTFAAPARLRARYTLERIFYDKTKVTPARIERYARYFDLPGSHMSYVRAAKMIIPTRADLIIRNIPKIQIPTLIIWGGDDSVVSLSHANRLDEEIRNSQLRVIPQCGHVPHEEQPETTAKWILEFLK